MWPVGLQEIIQRVRAWARRLWRPRQVSNPLAPSKQRQPNTRGHQEGGEGAAATVSSREANPTDEPTDEFPAEDELGVQAVETGSDNETPPSQSDQPVVDDNEPAKADVTDGVYAVPPNPSIPQEDTPEKPESASTQYAKGPSCDAPRSNAEVSDPSVADSTGIPSAPLKKAEPPRDDISSGISNSPGSKAKEGRSKPNNRGRKGPSQIGGRRTGPPTSSKSRPRRQPTSRPELICRKYDSQWEVVISANVECQIKEVRHNGGSSDMKDGEYRLRSFAGSLSVAYKDGKHIEFPLFDEKPLIFKLRADWKGDGRQVNSLTNGHFIVIAPSDWMRTGHVSVAPDGCTDIGFSAHYFYRTRNESTGDVGGFDEYDLPLTAPQANLEGETVFDDSEKGQLFGGNAPPSLISAPGVAWVRVGEEGHNGWTGENFKPAEQTLAEVLGRRQGRFFVRVYDEELKLLDRCEFRYLRNLKEIQVNDKPYTEHTILAPSPTGHLPAEVRFISTDGASIHPILPPKVAHAKLERGNLIVEPHPIGDDISFELESDAGRVDIVLHLPRIWWQMKQDASEPDVWCDTPLTMTRQEFREYADMDATMRLRFPRRIKSVRAGFDGELDRVYGLEKDEMTDVSLLVIPLADFADYSQIDQRLNEDALFNVECHEITLMLIRVYRDPMPMIISFTYEPETVIAGEQATLHWATRDTEAGGISIDPEIGAVESSGSVEITSLKTTVYTLRLTTSGLDDVTKAVTVAVRPLPCPDEKPSARVRRASGGWKRGKGFSYGELEVTGLAMADAAHRSIPIDRRRRSTHRENVETIRRSIDA